MARNTRVHRYYGHLKIRGRPCTLHLHVISSLLPILRAPISLKLPILIISLSKQATKQVSAATERITESRYKDESFLYNINT